MPHYGHLVGVSHPLAENLWGHGDAMCSLGLFCVPTLFASPYNSQTSGISVLRAVNAAGSVVSSHVKGTCGPHPGPRYGTEHAVGCLA